MVRPAVLLLAAALACVLGPAARSAAPPRQEVRALWVARTTLATPGAISRMVDAAHASGFNTLLVQVRARGDAYYRSGIEPRADALAGQPAVFDPLAFTLVEARRAGLSVHAWMCVNLVSSAVELPSSRSHVVYRHPEWLMVPKGLGVQLHAIDPRSPRYLAALARASREQSADVEGLFLSPADPAAADYLARIVGELVTRYAVDGVHLDYVRYPNEDFDYSRRALSLFAADVDRAVPAAEARRLRARAAADPFAYTAKFPERWRQFRRARLTALVLKMRTAVTRRRPDVLLSAAVVPDPTDAAERRLQDWRQWAADGVIDAVCPMAYATDTPTFTAQLQAATQAAGRTPLWAGIGAYRLSPAQTIEDINVARRLGAAGVVLFSYDSLIGSSPNGAALSQIGRAAFGRP